jgi:hypothetical protein
MRKFLFLQIALICFSLTAAAQDSTGVPEGGSAASEPAAPVPLVPQDRNPWQVAVGFKYLHFNNVFGQTFPNYALQTSVTRYFTNWIGAEGTAIAGFRSGGSASESDSVFIGGGPHIAIPKFTRIEPWFHALVGWQHFRFEQTPTVGSESALGFQGGGGLDWRIGPRLSLRVQGDYVGSHFGNSIQSSYGVGTGIVIDF